MAKKFWWFKGASVTELKNRLNGATDPKLEVRIEKNAMTLTVVSDVGTAEGGGPINESHICPPFCG